MKKTYNVYSTKMMQKSLKALSVSFIFALFFLGMSSNANAQLATSRASLGAAADADYSITQKAEITASDEDVKTILESELNDARTAARDAADPREEAKFSAKRTFLLKALFELNERGASVNQALFIGHSHMAAQITRFDDATQLYVSADDIARDVVERLK